MKTIGTIHFRSAHDVFVCFGGFRRPAKNRLKYPISEGFFRGFCESPTAQKFDILNHRRWLSKQPSLFHYFQTPYSESSPSYSLVLSD